MRFILLGGPQGENMKQNGRKKKWPQENLPVTSKQLLRVFVGLPARVRCVCVCVCVRVLGMQPKYFVREFILFINLIALCFSV